MVKYEMLGLAAKYGLRDYMCGLSAIRSAVWCCLHGGLSFSGSNLCLLTVFKYFYMYVCESLDFTAYVVVCALYVYMAALCV